MNKKVFVANSSFPLEEMCDNIIKHLLSYSDGDSEGFDDDMTMLSFIFGRSS